MEHYQHIPTEGDIRSLNDAWWFWTTLAMVEVDGWQMDVWASLKLPTTTIDSIRTLGIADIKIDNAINNRKM